MNNNSKKEEVRSGEETSRNPRAYTERSPRRYVRTVKLVKTLHLDLLTFGGKTKDITESDVSYN